MLKCTNEGCNFGWWIWNKNLVEFHKEHNDLVTITSVQPSGHFGAIDAGENDVISSFEEKLKGDVGWGNGCFFF
jgi:glucose-1-phosphate cytidylyltransferase